jgi:hypothetical protein
VMKQVVQHLNHPADQSADSYSNSSSSQSDPASRQQKGYADRDKDTPSAN